MADRRAIAGIVLVGGRSSRMGRDKATLRLGGRSLLERTLTVLGSLSDELVVVRAPGQALGTPRTERPLRVVEDPVEGEGPLVGIAAGLAAVTSPRALLAGVDMPFLRPELLRLLAGRLDGDHRWVVPVAGGRAQPLCSAIATDALPVIRSCLAAGHRAPMRAADELNALLVPPEEWAQADPQGWSFVDADTPEQFDRLVELLGRGEAPPDVPAPRGQSAR